MSQISTEGIIQWRLEYLILGIKNFTRFLWVLARDHDAFNNFSQSMHYNKIQIKLCAPCFHLEVVIPSFHKEMSSRANFKRLFPLFLLPKFLVLTISCSSLIAGFTKLSVVDKISRTNYAEHLKAPRHGQHNQQPRCMIGSSKKE